MFSNKEYFSTKHKNHFFISQHRMQYQLFDNINKNTFYCHFRSITMHKLSLCFYKYIDSIDSTNQQLIYADYFFGFTEMMTQHVSERLVFYSRAMFSMESCNGFCFEKITLKSTSRLIAVPKQKTFS